MTLREHYENIAKQRQAIDAKKYRLLQAQRLLEEAGYIEQFDESGNSLDWEQPGKSPSQ